MGTTYRICVCFTKRFRITEADPPPEVKEAFKKYSDGGAHITAEQFRRFLVEVQGKAGATIADAKRIVEQVLHKRHHIAKFTRHTLTLDDFHHYLFSADLNPPIGSQYVKHVFASCDDLLRKKKFCYILAQLGITFELDEEMAADDEEREALQEIINNTKLSEGYLTLARDIEVMEPKSPEDIYKAHLLDCRASAGASVDSARQNLAATFVNAFVNAGFGQDKLMTVPQKLQVVVLQETGSSRIKNMEKPVLQQGMILLWDVDSGLAQIDKYFHSNDNHVIAGALLGVGIVNWGIKNDYDPRTIMGTKINQEGFKHLKCHHFMYMKEAVFIKNFTPNQLQEGVIRLVQYLSQNDVLGKEQVKIVVDAGTGTTTICLGLGAICLGQTWEVYAVMLAENIDGYRRQEEQLISEFQRCCAFPIFDQVLNKANGRLVHWLERSHPRKKLDEHQRKCMMWPRWTKE